MALDWSAGQGRVAAGGKMLEWASWGPVPGDDPVIVLLHEGLGCVALWRDFPEKLAKETGLSVFAYSRAGYGQSDPADLPLPLDYMTREAVDVLPNVLDEIGAARYLLVGHSDGATIAAIHAGSVPDHRVRGIVLMAPHFFTEEMGLAEIADARKTYATTELKGRMAKYHRDPDHTFYAWNDAWLDPKFKAWNVADVIDYIRIPALVIQGRADQYGTLAQVEEVESRSYAPVETLVLDDCRHSPQFDQPEKVLAAVTDFSAHLAVMEAAEPER